MNDLAAHGRKPRESTGRGRADLHVHTLYSDGGQSPEAVVRAVAGRVDVVGITDHDRVGGALRARLRARAPGAGGGRGGGRGDQQLYRGLAGQGAWVNDRPLRLAPAPLSSRSLFCARTPYRDGAPEVVQRWLSRYRLRRMGSTALHLCYAAAGAIAFVHDQRATLWDIAGAAPVVIEAGGLLTGERGSPLFPLDPDGYHGEPIALLAGDPLAHDQALRELLALG